MGFIVVNHFYFKCKLYNSCIAYVSLLLLGIVTTRTFLFHMEGSNLLRRLNAKFIKLLKFNIVSIGLDEFNKLRSASLRILGLVVPVRLYYGMDLEESEKRVLLFYKVPFYSSLLLLTSSTLLITYRSYTILIII